MVSCNCSSFSSLSCSFFTACGSSALISAHASAADFVQQAPDMLPFLHIAVPRRVLLFFLAHGKIGRPGDQHRGSTGVDGKTIIHVLCQLPDAPVKIPSILFLQRKEQPIFSTALSRKLFFYVYISEKLWNVAIPPA